MKNILKELRESKNWTQKELSIKLGVSTRTIISLEKGQFNPSIMVAYKCSLIFGCPIEKIFCLEENYDNDRKEVLR
ncbi:helix-turn-helix transcriptional regulator [Aedoeadaptatus acetigenes]|uniref:Helix-turn-helix transcriptional regulator n=1 Tax=Aedoeadaptatus acetigenes TaxID=2981723 RepID=A0ABV1J3V6_9FIRM|nr:helix-turn-helix transcriptional regulator [Aedoeadaptatus acetigenes]MBS6524513.1 helix-turn-helix transcriptional regulator [Peptoniphilaceae bacterium]MCU6785770.1 helix-turn-helix transcriptional regulator [Aedoeadaptatus acetigenes]